MNTRPSRRTAIRSIRTRRGFTLLEIMIVAAIIGMLLSIAIPTFRSVRRSSQNTAFANDLRAISSVLEQYATEHGVWPVGSLPGAIPTGLEGSLNDRVWTARNPIGGQFFIVRDESGARAGIGCVGHVAQIDQIAELDSKIDDGGLASGLLRLDGDRIVYILERN